MQPHGPRAIGADSQPSAIDHLSEGRQRAGHAAAATATRTPRCTLVLFPLPVAVSAGEGSDGSPHISPANVPFHAPIV